MRGTLGFILNAHHSLTIIATWAFAESAEKKGSKAALKSDIGTHNLPRIVDLRVLKLKIRQHECNQGQNGKNIARAHDITRLFANTQVARERFRGNAHVPRENRQQQ